MTEEKIFLDENNTLVSTTRIIIAGTTYATSNVTSVACGVVEPKRGCAIMMIVFGGLFLLAGLNAMIQDTAAVDLPIFSLVIIIVGGFWFKGLHRTYSVLLSSSSGQRQILQSTNQAWIDRVIYSINKAIIARG